MNKYFGSFRKLFVWQEAKRLVLDIYVISAKFPRNEQYGLTSQLRRAASSVMANIAEGNDRKSVKDRGHFFMMAKSSLSETDCFLELAQELQYLDDSSYSAVLSQLNKTASLLLNLMISIKE